MQRAFLEPSGEGIPREESTKIKPAAASAASIVIAAFFIMMIPFLLPSHRPLAARADGPCHLLKAFDVHLSIGKRVSSRKGVKRKVRDDEDDGVEPDDDSKKLA